MIEKLPLFWNKLRESLWFLPMLLAISGGILSWFALGVKAEPLEGFIIFKWLMQDAGPRHAHNLLASLLASMITMTSLVVSLTMVVLTLSVRQLGPRLIGYVMGSTVTQCILGVFIGTIVYLLLTLRVIHQDMPSDAVPHFATALGSLLSLLSIFLLLFFIHHLGRSIVADEVIQRIGLTLECDLKAYADDYAAAETDIMTSSGPSTPILASRSGYIQVIDYKRLVSGLEACDGQLVFEVRAGQHVLSGTVCGWLFCEDKTLPAKTIDSFVNSVTIGDHQVAGQDIEFGLRRLVEIALRALSSGENEAYTAIRVIDQLGRALTPATSLRAERRMFMDNAGKVRLSIPRSTFSALLDASFREIRQSSNNPSIHVRILETLTGLAAGASDEAHAPIKAQGLKLWSSAASEIAAHNLGPVEMHYKRLLRNTGGS
jgi:uncharacterized membrane protein